MSIENAIAIPGWMSPRELAFLAFAAQKATSIIEIGSWRGRSAVAMADNTSGTVHCVDTWADDAYGAVFDGDAPDLCHSKDWLWNEFRKNVGNRLGARLFPHRMNSVQGAIHLSSQGITADMIFIDAGHREIDVVQDIEAWRPLLRPGGLLCGHDYHDHHPDVKAVVERMISDFYVVDSIWVAK